LPGVVNLHLDATEHGEELVFLHAVKEGPANRSYGLAVARLAGVPREVVGKAREYLALLESQRTMAAPTWTPQAELPLFAPAPPSPLELRLAEVRPDELSPREALQLLYELQQAALESLRRE
jgi:DNA mismatch repair protein MutS